MNSDTSKLDTLAVVLEQPKQLSLQRLPLTPPGDADAVVEIDWSGISTGTERLLWSGRMPPFPGMGYPLVPGYESVGRVVHAGPDAGVAVGDYVFVPGALCYGEVRGLFGGASARVVVPGARLTVVDEALGEQTVLFALAATAYHAIATPDGGAHAELIIGHGVLGRLLARIAALGEGDAPVVWEVNPDRAAGAEGFGYSVVAPDDDPRRDYRRICDVSGDPAILDTLVGRLAPQGEIVLAGFYSQPLSFDFPPAFMREARFKVAAQWHPADLVAVKELVESGRLSLDGLITHREPATEADRAYRTAFGDPMCLKMILDWRAIS
ncbi:2-desacetyl-2-hydroxyethyl bacteriochlorophyllide A dehydrogenase [Marichromatium purpuratum 984]|uniref:2-desacetyl-2-hydroxyethyl bacteriochlorophyllide A dehydrogenase n=1 Tax=Marichromatium purpuratum 984 TaxID=765910 RepID=W0E1I3_MARPU|nr:chlorophyll synthesis pathway protein BchC [Marichromatium purpuratum]AHF04705.1 2-desacetyl-2-hydroxyethyl bacteriochlorophyllide A dehydrogenase [Marichromatium purpuratum 984]